LIFVEKLVDICFHTCRFCQAVKHLKTLKIWIFADCIESFLGLQRKTLHSQQIFIFWKSSYYWQLCKICKCDNICSLNILIRWFKFVRKFRPKYNIVKAYLWLEFSFGICHANNCNSCLAFRGKNYFILYQMRENFRN
jgi:hypothetical protein